MKRVALFALGFLAGAYVALELVDRLLGGRGPRIAWNPEIDYLNEPGGGWQW